MGQRKKRNFNKQKKHAFIATFVAAIASVVAAIVGIVGAIAAVVTAIATVAVAIVTCVYYTLGTMDILAKWATNFAEWLR